MNSSGTNATNHHAFSTRSRMPDDICGIQWAWVLIPAKTNRPASDAPAMVAKYTSASIPSYASRSVRSTFA